MTLSIGEGELPAIAGPEMAGRLAEGTVDVREVRRALGGLRIKAPGGFEVVMDLTNHHLHNPAVIGRITADARIVPIRMSDGLIAPEPWSPWLDRDERDVARNGSARQPRELALVG